MLQGFITTKSTPLQQGRAGGCRLSTGSERNDQFGLFESGGGKREESILLRGQFEQMKQASTGIWDGMGWRVVLAQDRGVWERRLEIWPGPHVEKQAEESQLYFEDNGE